VEKHNSDFLTAIAGLLLLSAIAILGLWFGDSSPSELITEIEQSRQRSSHNSG
jgi:hypothetical protein